MEQVNLELNGQLEEFCHNLNVDRRDLDQGA